MTSIPERPDEDLWELDVEAAVRAGLGDDEPAREFLFGDAAIAAARDAEDFGVGPYPMVFLSACVRSMGIVAALRLPEPVIGDEAVVAVRGWMSAAHAAAGPDLNREMRFAQWLEAVGMLMAARRSARDTGGAAADRGAGPPGD
ncbi:hypothetical protein [Nocardia sp. BMG111209]|uniref:hypothetical protein n=1 Tax=Nocardia sp. BMG111209 TaxID=1160137 RepID=UPI00036490DE|nr:hypothetical protein [Nocardia sp. BMG111209]